MEFPFYTYNINSVSHLTIEEKKEKSGFTVVKALAIMS